MRGSPTTQPVAAGQSDTPPGGIMVPLQPQLRQERPPSSLAGVFVNRVLRNPVARRGSWAIFDQVVVSGTSLMATVIVGRTLGTEGLGAYALGITLIAIAQTIHESLVSAPYTILSPRQAPRGRAVLAGNLVAIHFVISILASLTAIGVGLTADYFHASEGSGLILALALAIAIPAVLTRELARRWAMAHLRVGLAVAIDILTAAIQLGLLLGLALSGVLTVASGFAALALGTIIAGIAGVFIQRRNFAWRLPSAQQLREPLRLGGWIFGSRLVGAAYMVVMPWLLVLWVNLAATGIFMACMTIVRLSNPLLLGMARILGPEAAVAYARTGIRGLTRVIVTALIVAGGLMLAFTGAMAVLGDWVIHIVFNDPSYAGFGVLIAILAFHAMLDALSICLHHGLVTAGKARIELLANCTSLVVGLSLAYPLMSQYGVVGAGIAIIIGDIAGLAIQAVAFWHLARGGR